MGDGPPDSLGDSSPPLFDAEIEIVAAGTVTVTGVTTCPPPGTVTVIGNTETVARGWVTVRVPSWSAEVEDPPQSGEFSGVIVKTPVYPGVVPC